MLGYLSSKTSTNLQCNRSPLLVAQHQNPPQTRYGPLERTFAPDILLSVYFLWNISDTSLTHTMYVFHEHKEKNDVYTPCPSLHVGRVTRFSLRRRGGREDASISPNTFENTYQTRCYGHPNPSRRDVQKTSSTNQQAHKSIERLCPPLSQTTRCQPFLARQNIQTTQTSYLSRDQETPPKEQVVST